MGIGEAIAKLFLQEGAKVVLCARDLARTKAAEQRIGGGTNTLSLSCDVSKREQIDAAVAETKSGAEIQQIRKAEAVLAGALKSARAKLAARAGLNQDVNGNWS